MSMPFKVSQLMCGEPGLDLVLKPVQKKESGIDGAHNHGWPAYVWRDGTRERPQAQVWPNCNTGDSGDCFPQSVLIA
jgi:hypothetical protein